MRPHSPLIWQELLVLPVRIELTTSPLPRGCSTTELRQRPEEMNALKNRGDHCHMGGNRASALARTGLIHILPDRWATLIAFWAGVCGAGDIASYYVHRHPEVRAKRASKDARPGPSPFEGRFAATSG
jgi:hypothetical protein